MTKHMSSLSHVPKSCWNLKEVLKCYSIVSSIKKRRRYYESLRSLWNCWDININIDTEQNNIYCRINVNSPCIDCNSSAPEVRCKLELLLISLTEGPKSWL